VNPDGANNLRPLQRYCAKSYLKDVNPGASSANAVIRGYMAAGTVMAFGHRYPGGEMRVSPTLTIWAENGTANSITTAGGVIAINTIQQNTVQIEYFVIAASATAGYGSFHYLADADF
jgi:hypothetical protein